MASSIFAPNPCPWPMKEVEPISLVEAKKTAMHGGLDEMLHFLRLGRTPQTECHDNIHSFAMVLGAIESSRSGSRVRIGDL